jgi:hypothetical protein
MDYTYQVSKQLNKIYSARKDLKRLTPDEVRDMVMACGDESLWVPVPGFSKLEANAKAGHLRMITNRKRLLGTVRGGGYVHMDLKGVPETPRGRFILLTFDRERKAGETVDHIDCGLPYLDTLSNLRWASKSQQSINQNRPSKRSTRQGYQTSTSKDFESLLENYVGFEEAATKYAVTKNQIKSAILHGHLLCEMFWRYVPTDMKDLPGECWKPAITYNGEEVKKGYEVSSGGRVRNLNFRNGKPSMGTENKATGYMQTSFVFENGRSRTVSLHISICETFHGQKPSPSHTVDHKDRNRKNNAANNLRWLDGHEQNLNRNI